jgi:exopolysaccharide production protein ExoQ
MEVKLTRIGVIERVFAVFSLMIATGSYDMIIFSGLGIDADTMLAGTSADMARVENSPVWVVIQYGSIAATLFLIGARWPQFLYAATRRRLVWAIVGLAMCSCLWGTEPDLALRKGFLLGTSTLFAVYLAFRYSLREQMYLLSWAIGIAMFSNIVFSIGFPAYAVHTYLHPGAWRGLYTHKNSLASFSVLGAVFFLILAVTHRRWTFWVGWAAAVFLVLMSTSKTGLTLFLLLSLLLPLFWVARMRRPAALPFLLIFALTLATVIVGLVGNYELILTSLGRDPTLTGRTGIWDTLIGKVALRPWLGYGYRGFWQGMDGESADIFYNLSFMVASAHNGYLDVSLELGLVGLAMFVGTIFKSFARAITWLRRSDAQQGLWPLTYLCYYALYNLTESNIPDPNSMTWVLYVSVTTAMLLRPLPDEPLVALPVLTTAEAVLPAANPADRLRPLV